MVERVLDDAAVSTVNLSEAQAKLIERGAPAALAWSWLVDLELDVVAFDVDQARVAAELRATTRHRGLSFGDRACLALAASRQIAAMTADRSWLGLDVGVEIQSIR